MTTTFPVRPQPAPAEGLVRGAKGDLKNPGLGGLRTAAGVPAFLYWRRGASAAALKEV